MTDPGEHASQDAAQQFERFIVQYVYREIGFIPVHLAALQSESDFEGVETELPLLVLWNEKDLGDRYSFQTWTNWSKVVEIAGLYDGPIEGLDDERAAQAALTNAYDAITKVATAAIYDLCEKSGRTPSQVCDDYWFPDTK
ncbi:MAG: hypothetical protein ACAH11_09670 [Sphingomonas sp.]